MSKDHAYLDNRKKNKIFYYLIGGQFNLLGILD